MKNLITYAKRFRIALIAMPADRESTLSQAADIALTLRRARVKRARVQAESSRRGDRPGDGCHRAKQEVHDAGRPSLG